MVINESSKIQNFVPGVIYFISGESGGKEN